MAVKLIMGLFLLAASTLVGAEAAKDAEGDDKGIKAVEELSSGSSGTETAAVDVEKATSSSGSGSGGGWGSMPSGAPALCGEED